MLDHAGGMGHPRAWYPGVPSTMDIAMALAALGAPHGTLVEAAFQSAGRGRTGRAWTAEPGTALLSSWVIRVQSGNHLAALSPLVALALIRAAEAIAPGAPVAFRWPNDVLVDNRKLGGILLISRPAGAEAVVIAGVGVNLDPGSVPDPATATCLREWAPEATIDALRNQLATELDVVIARFVATGGLAAGDRQALERRMAWRDEEVEVLESACAIRGRMVGLDTDGALRIRRSDDGSMRTFRAAEVTRGPRTIVPDEPENSGILP